MLFRAQISQANPHENRAVGDSDAAISAQVETAPHHGLHRFLFPDNREAFPEVSAPTCEAKTIGSGETGQVAGTDR
jgi:hypothetical protein